MKAENLVLRLNRQVFETDAGARDIMKAQMACAVAIGLALTLAASGRYRQPDRAQAPTRAPATVSLMNDAGAGIAQNAPERRAH